MSENVLTFPPPPRTIRMPGPIAQSWAEKVLFIELKNGNRYALLPDGTVWRLKKIRARAEFQPQKKDDDHDPYR